MCLSRFLVWNSSSENVSVTLFLLHKLWATKPHDKTTQYAPTFVTKVKPTVVVVVGEKSILKEKN